MKRKIGELILIIFFYLLQVTLGRVIAIGGIKPNLPKPFMVMATQNPFGSIGTQKLPESPACPFYDSDITGISDRGR